MARQTLIAEGYEQHDLFKHSTSMGEPDGEYSKDTSVSDTSPPPIFEITYLGSTELHDVYHIALYPALVGNLEAQSQYKQQIVHALAQARHSERNIWAAVDLGHLTTAQLVNLSYRIGLPFMHQPMTIKTYGIGPIVVVDAATKSLDWLMRHTFKMEFVADRQAALPPDLVGGD